MGELTIDWRWTLARGILGIIFGLILLFFPIAGLVTIALLFAIYAVGDGAMALSAAWRMRNKKGRGLVFFEGVIGILAGILAIFYPGAALLALVILMSAWALMTGAAELYFAFSFRDLLAHPVFLGLAGLASVIFGILILIWPMAGALTLLAMLAFYSLFFGFFLTLWGIRLKQRRPLETRVGAV